MNFYGYEKKTEVRPLIDDKRCIGFWNWNEPREIVDYKNNIENIENKFLINEIVHRAFGVLTKDESRVIKLRYGFFDDGKRNTQREVANILHLSRSLVSRMEHKAIKKMRKVLKGYVI